MFTDVPRQYFFSESFVCFVFSVSHAFASVHCCIVVNCWERADLLALFGDVYCMFVTFLYGILHQVCYLIVSFPGLCLLSSFLSILVRIPWKITKLESQHSMSGHHRPANDGPF